MKRHVLVHALLAAAVCSASAAFGQSSAQKTDWKFAFGSQPAPGFTPVKPDETYAADRGYGFEPGAAVSADAHGVASDKPFYFSAAVPEGNYNVTVTFGGEQPSDLTVKAELRRLMLWNVHSDAGQTVSRTFTVNVRTPAIPGGEHVHLKGKRESQEEAWAWDDQLELEFNGEHPNVDSIEIHKVDCPTIFVLGDSTVCDQPTEPWNSWGQMLTLFFKPGIAVSNQAESGETLKSSLAAHRLDKVLSQMKSGDYLLIQYGHNDMKEKGEGVGAFGNYTEELKQFVDGARSKGGTPILITSMNRKSFDSSGHIVNTLKDYPEAVRKLAAAEHVPLIDLNAMSKTLYEAIGPAHIDEAFATVNGKHDGTHHDAYGSYELAQCVVLGIEQDKIAGLTKYIIDDFHFDPAQPNSIADFHYPASPVFSVQKPLGS